jgi:hypothetical protein
MYLYSRGLRIIRNVEDTLRVHGEICRLVNANSGMETRLWASALSPAPNSIVYTAMVDGRQDVADAMQKLALVPEFSNLVESVRGNVSPAVDAFRWVLNGDALDLSQDPKPIANVMAAQIVGDLGKAFEWSLEMAAFSTTVTGAPIAVTVNTIGPMGQINWMAGVDTMSEVDAAEMALWSDPGYMERLSEARAQGFFGPGPGAMGASVFTQIG